MNLPTGLKSTPPGTAIGELGEAEKAFDSGNFAEQSVFEFQVSGFWTEPSAYQGIE